MPRRLHAAALTTALTALALLAPSAQAQEMTRHFGSGSQRPLKVRSTTDIAIFAPVIEAFLSRNPDIAIDYEQWGSNALFDLSLAECKAALSGQAQTGSEDQADVVISSAVHQMVELVNLGCGTTFRSPQTSALAEPLRWRDELWGITREAAVVIYNRALVPPEDIPSTRFALLDLLRPAGSPYAGRVATYDIEESGLGYLFAFKDSQEASTFGALLESFDRSGAVATCCSAEIIDGVGDGRYLLAYNVLGSYALAAQDPRVGIVLPQDYTLVLSRAFMIPKHAFTPTAGGWEEDTSARARAASFEAAAKLLDFLLSDEGVRALRSVHLISADLVPDAPETPISRSALRPIELMPTLLVARDTLTRNQFIARWRDTFSQDGKSK
mgnify:CR=1 FL=1